MNSCLGCYGKGKVVCRACKGLGGACGRCRGNGEIICTACNGFGFINKELDYRDFLKLLGVVFSSISVRLLADLIKRRKSTDFNHYSYSTAVRVKWDSEDTTAYEFTPENKTEGKGD